MNPQIGRNQKRLAIVGQDPCLHSEIGTVFLPDIGVDIDEAAFDKATAQIFGRMSTTNKNASPLKTNKKKKKVSPHLRGTHCIDFAGKHVFAGQEGTLKGRKF